MALFGKADKDKAKEGPAVSQIRPVLARTAHCRVCDGYRQLSRCWLRVDRVIQCPCCGMAFDDLDLIYHKFQPTCPTCHEYLEQPGFEYGVCDGCGSKYEVMPGTKPGLLPNKAQRSEMNKHGRSWRLE